MYILQDRTRGVYVDVCTPCCSQINKNAVYSYGKRIEVHVNAQIPPLLKLSLFPASLMPACK